VSGWKERLQALDGLGPDDDVYWRAQEGPRRSELPDGPSAPKRLAAAAVAFAVFAAAAVFGWQAFRPPGDQEPVGPSATTATITLAGTEDGPSATLSYDGAEQSGAFEEYVWCNATAECTAGAGESAYPPIDEGLAIPAGTPIRFDGDGRVERFVVRTPEGNRSSPNVVVDTDGTDASVPDEPGDYLLWVAADWEQGSGAFYLSVRAIPGPESQGDSGEVEALATESFRVRAPVGAIAATDGWVWASTSAARGDASLERIDPRTGVATLSIPLPSAPSYLVGDGDALWASVRVDDSPTLIQVDGTTGEVVRQYPGLGGPLVAASNGTVWAISDGPHGGPDIVQLDPRSGSIVARVSTPVTPFDMTEAGGSIWALLLPQADGGSSGGLARIDALSGEVQPLNVTPAAPWMAGSDEGVWLSVAWSDHRGTSTFVSAASNEVSPVGDIYNFRPFAVEASRVWFIAGPHDGQAQGICALNIETQAIEACGDDHRGPDLQAGQEAAAYEPVTGTLWVGVYLRPLVTRVGSA